MHDRKPPFCQSKALAEMSKKEWESLCDGCGLCCLNKIEDEDSGDYYYTNVACSLLDAGSGRCMEYSGRRALKYDCLQLTPENIEDIHWLPVTCAYRLIHEGRDLPSWHPLISGDPDSVHRAGISMKGRVVSEDNFDFDDEDLSEHVVDWVKI
ncbi:MAG: YcgN family cysteine cluster protein [bacterium]|nr:YcgN family cysteine cluster protein [bacterium]